MSVIDREEREREKEIYGKKKKKVEVTGGCLQTAANANESSLTEEKYIIN